MTDVAAFLAGAVVFGGGLLTGMALVLAFQGRAAQSDD